MIIGVKVVMEKDEGGIETFVILLGAGLTGIYMPCTYMPVPVCCGGLAGLHFRVKQLDFLLKLFDFVAQPFDFLLELAHQRIAALALGIQETKVVAVGAKLGTASLQHAGLTFAFAHFLEFLGLANKAI